jgi:ribosome biogenesis GTPase
VRLDSGISDSPLTGQTVDCRARGNFRHEHTTPLVGDLVTVQYDDSSYADEEGRILPDADGTGIMIAEILPRRNSLIRPPLANVDVMLVVIAAASPDPDIPTIDKLLTILEFNRIEPVIIIGKSELKPKRSGKIAALYEKIGYRTFVLSCYTGEGVQAFSDFAHTELRGKITAVAGASGAGKSTLLNTVFPNFNLVTGDISEKIGRGKNTTRHTELFDLPGTAGGYIADTAGFSLLDFERFDFFTLEDLPHTLREFAPHLGKCRYTDCTHINDEECAILEAVQAGEISKTRHEAYKELYTILKEKKKYK